MKKIKFENKKAFHYNLKKYANEKGVKIDENELNFIFNSKILSNEIFVCNNHFETARKKNLNKNSIPYFALHNLSKVENINSKLSEINKSLVVGCHFLGFATTNENIKSIMMKKYSRFIYKIFLFNYYLFYRLIPKILRKKNNRVISNSEMLGRLTYNGFETINFELINNRFFFICKKTKNCAKKNDLYYGPIIKLQRRGINGELITVYKFRTMYGYSEFIQEFIFKRNKLKHGGKINNDFRISSIGRFFRKYWIDEIPMIFNILKGDIKLVGVRPISNHYFNLYPEKLKNLRDEVKPGYIPPFYVDMPNTFKEIIASEIKYLESYKKSPYITDFRYFFKALYNVFIRGKRSG